MDNKRNLLSMDFASNPDLKALVSAWSVGESYDLKLKLQLNEMTDEGAKFTVQEVTYEEPGAKEEPEPIKPEGNEPVMIVMGAGKPEPYVAP